MLHICSVKSEATQYCVTTFCKMYVSLIAVGTRVKYMSKDAAYSVQLTSNAPVALINKQYPGAAWLDSVTHVSSAHVDDAGGGLGGGDGGGGRGGG